jgi:hypothetical protein
MVPLIPIALGIGVLLALLAGKRANAATSPATAPRTSTAAAVDKIVASGDPRKMVAAVQVAHEAGDHQLAADIVKKAQGAAVVNSKVFPSPWGNVPDLGWTKFVTGMRGKDPRVITPGYTLGLFNFGMRRLVDIGLANNPHQGEYKGKKVWLADWAGPLQPGPDKFLGDADTQYKAFIRSNQLYAGQIKKEIPEAIGATLDGKTVTLSGLLAVAHRAGWAGLRKWLSDAPTRAEHKQSTEIFNKLNGAF